MVVPPRGGDLKPSVELMREVKVLSIFNDDELQMILNLGEVLNYEAFTNILIEGELSWGLYLIVSGTVGIYKTNKMSGNHYDVGQLTTGSFFGELSLVDENARSATVRALTETHVVYISKESFHRFLSTSEDRKIRFYETCVKTLVSRLRKLNDNYVISQYQLWKNAVDGKDRLKRKKKEAA